MSLRPSPRWAVPAAVAVAVAASVGATHAFAASPHPTLPDKTPAQLIAAVEQSHVQALSGTVKTVADLGLPALPDNLVAGTNLTSLLSGTHTLRVACDGPQKQRIALLDNLAESDLIHNGSDVWTYASRTNTVTHYVLPARPGGRQGGAEPQPTPGQELTPQGQADRILKAIGPSTSVTVDKTARVADRPAYQLVISPKTTDTTIRSITIAIDSATSVPLRVQVFARGSSDPALQVGFTKVTFTAPPASTFAFTPPRGATVKESSLGALGHHEKPGTTAPHASTPMTKPTVLGQGWSTILELPAGTVPMLASQGSAPGGMLVRPPAGRSGHPGILRHHAVPAPAGGNVLGLLQMATTQTPQGRLLSTRLINMLFAPDGRVFVGAVPAASLEHAAAAVGG